MNILLLSIKRLNLKVNEKILENKNNNNNNNKDESEKRLDWTTTTCCRRSAVVNGEMTKKNNHNERGRATRAARRRRRRRKKSSFAFFRGEINRFLTYEINTHTHTYRRKVRDKIRNSRWCVFFVYLVSKDEISSQI